MPGNASNALLFLLDTLFMLYVIVLLVRVLLQLTHAPFHNPISQLVWRVTARPVAILAMGIPRWRNIDIPAVVLAILLCLLNIELGLLLTPGSAGIPILAAVGFAVLKLVRLLCNLYFFTILVEALMSWLSSARYSPAAAILTTLNAPLLRPVRRRLPSIAGLDLSPLVVLIALQVVIVLLQPPLWLP